MRLASARLIGFRHLWRGPRGTLVLLTRNEGGSVAGHCLLDGVERPVIDGPTAAGVLAAIADALDVLVLARRATITTTPVRQE